VVINICTLKMQIASVQREKPAVMDTQGKDDVTPSAALKYSL